MKKQIRLPSGALGSLSVVNIDLEMRAKHYDLLTTVSPDHNEECVLSILKDLMEEDPYQLTQIDLMYLFTLVKLASIGDELRVETHCPLLLTTKTGSYRPCNTKHSLTFSLSESEDLKMFKGKIPTFTLPVNGKDEIFNLNLPTMATEIELLEELTASGKSRKEALLQDKASLTQYAKKRMVAHLVSNQFTKEQLLTALEESSFKKITELTALVRELNSYGLIHKTFEITCKECGGKYTYRLPLLFGLSL